MSGERIETAGEYAPTTDCVRDVYVAWTQGGAPGARLDVRVIAAEFDRWFAQVTAEAEARGAARALLEAADDAEALSAAADLAKIVAPVDGGGRRRHEVIDRAAAMHEEPWTWLRARTAQTGGTDD